MSISFQEVRPFRTLQLELRVVKTKRVALSLFLSRSFKASILNVPYIGFDNGFFPVDDSQLDCGYLCKFASSFN